MRRNVSRTFYEKRYMAESEERSSETDSLTNIVAPEKRISDVAFITNILAAWRLAGRTTFRMNIPHWHKALAKVFPLFRAHAEKEGYFVCFRIRLNLHGFSGTVSDMTEFVIGVTRIVSVEMPNGNPCRILLDTAWAEKILNEDPVLRPLYEKIARRVHVRYSRYSRYCGG